MVASTHKIQLESNYQSLSAVEKFIEEVCEENNIGENNFGNIDASVIGTKLLKSSSIIINNSFVNSSKILFPIILSISSKSIIGFIHFLSISI